MDPRLRADETLAHARARGAFVVTPDNATSPMDASTTVRIPREVIEGSVPDGTDPDSTVVIPHPGQQQAGQQHPGQQQTAQQQAGQQQAEQQQAWPTTDQGGQGPPNPYRAQRGPDEFGPLGSQATQQQFPPPPQ